MQWYIKVIKNYGVFEGRARRKEYWMFILCNFFITFVLGFISGFFEGFGVLGIIANLYEFAVLIPTIAVGVRRMHDTNHSGWFLLIPFYNLILAVRDSDPNINQFGPNPKAEFGAPE